MKFQVTVTFTNGQSFGGPITAADRAEAWGKLFNMYALEELGGIVLEAEPDQPTEDGE